MLHLILEDNNVIEENNNQGETLWLWGIGPWEPNEWKEKILILDQNNSLSDDEYEPSFSEDFD